jgi:hypothetical protein
MVYFGIRRKWKQYGRKWKNMKTRISIWKNMEASFIYRSLTPRSSRARFISYSVNYQIKKSSL